MHDTNGVPKIIHQIWIGPKPAPIKLMNTWKEKHPDFEYIFWNDKEFEKRGMTFECQDKIDEMEEYCGKTDIMRWEILYKYGGVYIDADSFCIEKLTDEMLKKSFAAWENEIKRPGLIAVGTMGFTINHSIPKKAIEFIKNNEVSYAKTGKMAWQNTGPILLTNLYNDESNNSKIIDILVSYTFLPHHFTGQEYKGHGKIYAYQKWGSTWNSYDKLNNTDLPDKYITPPIKNSVSILISSYNTKTIYVKECLESIKNQTGWFNIELIWINDGSDSLNTKILKGLLANFEKSTRFTKIIYHENEKNMGVSFSLNLGITLCSNELIFRMDSDDIMVENRIEKQINYMLENKNIQICGGQISMFKENIQNVVSITKHKPITLKQFKKNPIHWIVNHPTLCYRKSAIINIGNYDVNFNKIEDFELMLRFLKNYRYIHNMDEVLLHYRLHNEQVTYNGCTEGREYWHAKRTELINDLINK
jgi:mannosyltransferase OCH1-like enzyme